MCCTASGALGPGCGACILHSAVLQALSTASHSNLSGEEASVAKERWSASWSTLRISVFCPAGASVPHIVPCVALSKSTSCISARASRIGPPWCGWGDRAVGLNTHIVEGSSSYVRACRCESGVDPLMARGLAEDVAAVSGAPIRQRLIG